MSLLESWTLGSHTAEGITHPTYRKGSGPGVIVIHEIPGITPAVLEFAEELVSRGFTVVMPSLFGRPGAEATVLEYVRSIAGVCVGQEFMMFARKRTTPVPPGCSRWPGNCTGSWVGPVSGQWACA